MIKLSGLVRTFKKSSSKSEELQQIQEEMGCDRSLTLIQNVFTRWDSQFTMLQRLLLLKVPAEVCIARNNAHKSRITLPVITEEEWTVIEEFVNLLEPVHKFTSLLQDTAHYGLPSFYSSLQEMFESIRLFDATTEAASQVQFCILEAVKGRFDMDLSKDYWISLKLDPLKSGCYLTTECLLKLNRKLKQMLTKSVIADHSEVENRSNEEVFTDGQASMSVNETS